MVTASVLVLAIVAGSVGLWIRWETGSVGCVGIIGQDVVFSDTAWDEEAGAVVARFEATLLGDGETGEYCLPLPNTEAGDVLSKSILPGETYAGFSYAIELPRREARALGLLASDGISRHSRCNSADGERRGVCAAICKANSSTQRAVGRLSPHPVARQAKPARSGPAG